MVQPKLDMANILLVEDEPISQRVAQLMLEGFGYQVHIASTGQKALELLQQYNFDLIFMDLGLPDMTGDQITIKIREQEASYSHIPIIALTAHVFHNDRKRCLAAGMDGFLGKPIEHADLLGILNTWLKK
jgi:CheY-like chemotaxis protein